MALPDGKVTLVVALMVVANLAPVIKALTCLNYTLVEGQMSPPPVVSKTCTSCSKMVVIYNSAGIAYKMTQWMCNNDTSGSATPSFPSFNSNPGAAAPTCMPSTTAVSYNDASMFMMACTCCRDNCNGAGNFCLVNGSLASCVGMNVPALPSVTLTAGDNGTVSINITAPVPWPTSNNGTCGGVKCGALSLLTAGIGHAAVVAVAFIVASLTSSTLLFTATSQV